MIVFDDQGEIWRASSRELKDSLGSSIGDRVLAEYSVVNIGFVAAEHVDKTVRIRVRPAVVSGAAFAGLLYWLYSRSIERVVVSWFEDMTWSHALVGSREAAVAHMDKLCRRGRHSEKLFGS